MDYEWVKAIKPELVREAVLRALEKSGPSGWDSCELGWYLCEELERAEQVSRDLSHDARRD